MLRGVITALIIGIAIWLLAIAVLFVLGRRGQARDLVGLVPNLVILFRGVLKDDRVPRATKGLVWFALVWLASPIDLIPEFIPVAGPLDDVIVAGLVLRHVLRRTDREVVDAHWRGEPSTLDAILTAGRRTTTPPD